jgi:plasmid replication initiation protein
MTFTGIFIMAKVIAEIMRDVKKPVEAIQCANTFSLIQRKMYNVLLANAAGNLRPEVTHQIPMGILCKLMGYHSKDYKTIKEKFRELRRMDIEWDIINDEGYKAWTNTSPLSLARVIEGKGICEYEFTPSLVPHLDRPAQYAKFSLFVQAQFKSGYGLALYENCERYRNIGQTKSFDIPTFRKLMGIKDDEYRDFFAFKRRVVVIAVKEVNKHADFEIVPEYEKSGRQVVKIRFIILNKKIALAAPVAEETDDEFIAILRDAFKLSKNLIEKYIKQYGKSYLKEKADYILNSASFKAGSIRNVAAYFKMALNSDYQPSVSSKEIINQHRIKDEEIKMRQKSIEDAVYRAKKSYELFVLDSMRKAVEQLKTDKRIQLEDGFEQYLQTENQTSYRSYINSGFKSVMVGVLFKMFIKMSYPEIFNAIASIDAYMKEHHSNLVPHLEGNMDGR